MKSKITKLLEYIENMGYSVTQNKREYTFNYIEKNINVWWKASDKSFLFLLLHETGHMLQSHTKIDDIKFHYSANDKKRNSNIYKVQTIHQEIDAWERGKKLAKKLELNINEKDYDNFAAKYVMSYIHFFA